MEQNSNFSQQLRQATDFLTLLFPEVKGYIEIRAIDKFGKISRDFFKDPQTAAEFAVGLGGKQTHNVYVGMAERRSASAGKKEDALRTLVKWCEIDASTYGGDKETALKRVQQLQNLAGFPAPSAVNNSGRGFYFF